MEQSSFEQFKDGWDTPERAAAYHEGRFSQSKRWRWIDERERTFVREWLATLPRGGTVLDAPCGTGRLVSEFQTMGFRYRGADLSLSMLNMARNRFSPLPLTASDILFLPFPNGAFDAVLSVRMLHRIREQQVRVAILQEMKRVSKGPLLVTYYTRWNIRGVQRWLRGRYPGLSLSTIAQDRRLAALQCLRAQPLNRWRHQQWFFALSAR
jgi:SAM-dependent methyltransferase